jgi:hypothetical protein
MVWAQGDGSTLGLFDTTLGKLSAADIPDRYAFKEEYCAGVRE